MSRHGPDHEARLRELWVAAELEGPPLDPELRECEECRAILVNFRATIAQLDQVAAEEARERQAALAQPNPALEEELEGFLRERMADDAGPAIRPLSRFAVLSLVAAAVLAVTIWWWPTETAPPPSGPWMGTPTEGLSPSGPVRDYGEFHWPARCPVGGWYAVRVHPANEPLGEPLTRSGVLHEARWSPDPKERVSWPAAIVWFVEVFDGSSEHPVELWHARASRSGSAPR